MILMSEELQAWGYIVTAHYTHPPRSVIMQASLAGREDFTQTVPGDQMFRGVAFFTSFVAGGVATDLMVAPLYGTAQFRADSLSEVSAELFAENCGAQALVTQFNRLATMPPNDSVDATFQLRTVAFITPANGTTQYKHIVKVFAGGRVVSEQEAIDTAHSNAGRIAIDLTGLQMQVTTGDASAALQPRHAR